MLKSCAVILLLLYSILSATEKKMIGYYSLVREVSDAQHIPYDKLTHINIENITVDTAGEIFIAGQDWAMARVNQIIDTIMTRSKENDVKVSIVVGYTAYTQEYINDSTQRSDFAKKIVQYCNDNNYDGVDLDFEGDFDENAYELFAKEIRELLPPEKLLTAAVGADTGSYANPYAWTDKMLSYCDWVNVMIYCIRGTWATSPVGSPANFEDFTNSATLWLKRLPKEKLVLGIPTHSTTFVDPDTTWWLNGTNFGVRRIWGHDTWSGNSIDYRYILKYFPEELRNDTVAGDFNMTLADIGLTTTEKLKEFNLEVCGDFDNSHPAKSTDMLGKTFFTGPSLTLKKAEWAGQHGYAGLMINHLHEDITKESTFIDTLLLDSLSIVRTAYNGFYNSLPISEKIIQKKFGQQITLKIKGKRIYCNKPFRSIGIYTISGKKIASIVNDNKRKIVTFPNKIAHNIYVVKVNGYDNTTYTDKINIESN